MSEEEETGARRKGTRRNITQAPRPLVALWVHPAGACCGGGGPSPSHHLRRTGLCGRPTRLPVTE